MQRKVLHETVAFKISTLPKELSEEESTKTDERADDGEATGPAPEGLPLKINEKYTKRWHLWCGKFAQKTQTARFCLNESKRSNSFQRTAIRSRGRANA